MLELAELLLNTKDQSVSILNAAVASRIPGRLLQDPGHFRFAVPLFRSAVSGTALPGDICRAVCVMSCVICLQKPT